jgi:hypothetical protein
MEVRACLLNKSDPSLLEPTCKNTSINLYVGQKWTFLLNGHQCTKFLDLRLKWRGMLRFGRFRPHYNWCAHFNRLTPHLAFEWYMARRIVKIGLHGLQKDMCHDEIEWCAHNIGTILGSIVRMIEVRSMWALAYSIKRCLHLMCPLFLIESLHYVSLTWKILFQWPSNVRCS